MNEYFPLLVYLVSSAVLSLLIWSLSFVFSTQKALPEKVSSYEPILLWGVGIWFYLVVILFIVLEVTSLDVYFCAGKELDYLSSIPEDPPGLSAFLKCVAIAVIAITVIIRVCSTD